MKTFREFVSESQGPQQQSWARVEAMDKGSSVGTRAQLVAKQKYLEAKHAHHKKFGGDVLKVTKELEAVNQALISKK